MRTLATVSELRAALAGPRADGKTIGLVPTMGAFHEGHLALMAAAREVTDVVVVSLFVNPTQFDEGADLDAYPRDPNRDAELAAAAGVDLMFAPATGEVYPPGFATSISVGGVSEPLEGVHRGPGHFSGVATVVVKLLGMVGPHVAFFGQKDAQQVLVIRRVVRDLDLPVRIEVVPTVREPDGLAMSSRNARLGPDDRERAVGLSRALRAAEGSVRDGETDPGRVLANAGRALSDHGVEAEYLELVSPESLAPVSRLDEPALLAVAARVGTTRLIDSVLLQTGHNGRPH
jgi:pantoate--beta-alanine ligase